jgi:putative hemolysin
MQQSDFRFFSFKKKKKATQPAVQEGELVIPSSRKIGTCMTHRSEIVWIDSGTRKEGIREILNSHPELSHFPVCAGTVDSVVGILSARSFYSSLQSPKWEGLKPLVNKPVYLPETASIAHALSVLAEGDNRMACIIDEYGGIEGIVTRNGLVGELLAELTPSSAETDPDVFKREDGSYLVSGQARMDEIKDTFDFPPVGEGAKDYYTLAGYLLASNGSIPKTGDRIACGPYACEIVDMDGHRIDKVLVTLTTPQSEA